MFVHLSESMSKTVNLLDNRIRNIENAILTANPPVGQGDGPIAVHTVKKFCTHGECEVLFQCYSMFLGKTANIELILK